MASVSLVQDIASSEHLDSSWRYMGSSRCQATAFPCFSPDPGQYPVLGALEMEL